MPPDPEDLSWLLINGILGSAPFGEVVIDLLAVRILRALSSMELNIFQ